MNTEPERPAWALAAALIAGAALAAYANTFSAPFIFDDIAAIVDNPTVRSLRDLGTVLNPPAADGVTVGGRPLLNLSFALNYALSGTEVWSYHALNLLIHALAGLTLFGLVRRTLGTTRLAAQALPVALFSALLWTLHPLHTESVTYVVQRAESLNGLFFLLTLYAFVRAATSARAALWLGGSVAACLLGAATKEVAVTAPLLVLLHDRTFVSGTFRAALARRPRYYAGLAATWFVLAWLVAGTAGRGGTAGLGVGVGVVEYAVTQLRALPAYLGLSAWPAPLVIDHGGLLGFASVAAATPYALLVFVLLGATAFALRAAPALGFCGAWFFVVLAPSSSVVPLHDTMFEHRMYLALAAPLVLAVAGARMALGTRATTVLALAALAFSALTFSRNSTYRSEVTLWSDNVAHTPNNPRAHFLLANALLAAGKADAAVASYRAAVRLNPHYIEAHNNLGAALLQANRVPESLVALETALRLRPIAKTHFTAATAFAQLGRIDEAISHYDAALRLNPSYAEAFNNRGNLRLQKKQAPAALADYEAALRIEPNYVEAHLNATVALIGLQRFGEAAAHAEIAVRVRPDFGTAHWKLGDALLELGRLPDAVVRYREAVRLDPSLVFAHHNLARVLAQLGQAADAIAAFERTLQLSPEWAAAHHHFARTLAGAGQIARAMAENETALRLQPDFPEARAHLEQLRARTP